MLGDFHAGPGGRSVLVNMANALPKSVSVNLLQHPFYDFKYDYSLKGRSGLKLVLLGPLLFAYLAAKYDKFIYIGAAHLHLHFRAKDHCLYTKLHL